MEQHAQSAESTQDSQQRKREESRLFIFLVVFLFPILAVVIVSGYGFLVWIAQMIFGPPGPG